MMNDDVKLKNVIENDAFVAACDDIILRCASIRKKIRDGEKLNNNDLYEINVFLASHQNYMERTRYDYIRKVIYNE